MSLNRPLLWSERFQIKRNCPKLPFWISYKGIAQSSWRQKSHAMFTVFQKIDFKAKNQNKSDIFPQYLKTNILKVD